MKKTLKIKQMVTLAILGALVGALSLIKIPLGQFSITLALIPLVIGSILYGPKGGCFLGLIMGLFVLIVDAAFFYALNPLGTIITVLVKSICAGMGSGLLYQLISKKNQLLGIICATIIAPIINTGVFIIGCYLFFYNSIAGFASKEGINTFMYIIEFYVSLNFIIELAINCVLCPTVVYLINNIAQKYDLASNVRKGANNDHPL